MQRIRDLVIVGYTSLLFTFTFYITLFTESPLMTAGLWPAKRHVHGVGRPLGVSDVVPHTVERAFKQFVHQLTYPLHCTLACWCILPLDLLTTFMD